MAVSFVCLNVAAPPADLPTALLAVAPHVVVDARGVTWIDAGGLDASDVARRALDLARRHGADAPRAGVAGTAIAAEVAAVHGQSPLVVVPVGTDTSFLARFALSVLAPDPKLRAALTGVGIATCGDLARLTRESVEVRFGPDGVALWRLARADDPRRIFTPTPRALPSASLAWEEYVLHDPEQLLFAANRLVATVCAELHAWGEAARALTLGLTLADRTTVQRPLLASRATASRTAWMRLVRLEFERLRLEDGVTGLSIQVEAASAAAAQQGDIFDRGFQTARAVDDALTQLADDGQAALVEPITSAHPLPERRVEWRAREPGDAPIREVGDPAGPWPGAPRLTLQIFPTPSPIDVVTTRQGDRRVPIRFRTPDVHETELLTAAGPDHVSAGPETGTLYAREYFTCLTGNGLLVLLYRDALTDAWYLHGWWE